MSKSDTARERLVALPERVERLVELVAEIPDHRRPGGNLRHPLSVVIVTAFCGALCGAQDFSEVVDFVETHEDFLNEFLDLSGGIPSADTYERIFRHLDPMALQIALIGWLKEVRKQAIETDALRPIVAIDGKTLRRTFDTKSGMGALHLVTAWASEEGLILGQVATDKKSNEITAIPELLKVVSTKAAIVTIDAMGCQKDIASDIVEGGGDYLLALKDNQPTLHEKVIDYFLAQTEKTELDQTISTTVKRERGHGREEMRTVWSAPAPADFDPDKQWKKLTSIVMVQRESTTILTGKQTFELRYYISSMKPDAAAQARAVRGHWGIENGQHHILDVCFNEDKSRYRKDRGPENWGVLNRVALSLAKNETSRKTSMKIKRKRAGWDTNYLRQLLCACP